MFASMGTTALPNSRHSQAFGKNYTTQLPKGFSVRVFKGPTLSSFPHTATAKFDVGYHTIPTTEHHSNQNYYSARPQSTTKSYSSSNEQTKSSRLPTNDAPTATSRSYESDLRTAASYSIYPGVSKDTYIYERSLSSKSDIYSNSEYDALTQSPSSIFSPAMSTDSLTTFKSPATPPTTLSDRDPGSSDPSASAPSRNSFAMHIPVLSQAQSAIKGIFRGQTPHEDPPSRMDNAFIGHTPSRPSGIPDTHSRVETPGMQGRSTTPIRLSSQSSGSEYRSTATSPGPYSTPSSGYQRGANDNEDLQENDLDRIARANAEYNAASSAQFHTRRQGSGETCNTFGVAPTHGQIFPDFPVRNSPEQRVLQHGTTSSYISDSIREPASSYFSTTDTTTDLDRSRTRSVPPRNRAQSRFDDDHSDHSEEFIPPLAHREWPDSIMGSQSHGRRPPVPERGALPIPQILNEGPQNRYVPASRTMTPHLPTTAPTRPEEPATVEEYGHSNERPLPIPPPTQQRGPRERRSSVSQPSNGAVAYSPTSFSNVREGPRVGREAESSRPPIQPLNSSPSHIPSPSSRAVQNDPPSSRRDLIDSRVDRDIDPTRMPVPSVHPPSSYIPRDTTMPRDFTSTSPRDAAPHPPETVSSIPQPQVGIYDNLRRSPPGPRPATTAPYPSRDIISPRDSPTLLATRQRDTSIFPNDRTARSSRNSPDETRGSSGRREASQPVRLDPSSIYSTREVSPRRDHLPAAPTQRELAAGNPPSDPGSYPRRNTLEEARDSPVWRAPQPESSRSQSQMEPRQQSSDSPQPTSLYAPPNPSAAGSSRNMSPPRNTTLPPSINSRDQGTNIIDRERGALRTLYPTPGPKLSASTNRPLPVQTPSASQSSSGPMGGSTGRFPDVTEPPRTSTSNIPNPVDPGQRNGQRTRRPSFATDHPRERAKNSTNDGTVERMPNPSVESSGERYTVGSTSPKSDTRPRTQTGEVHRQMAEPQRRHSDGDRPINTGIASSQNGAPYMSHSVPDRSFRTPAPVEPQRRFSDGDQAAPSYPPNGNALILSRSVRWNENLVCPSPIFASQRRKGWFNRRGDQLWTNEGSYKPLPPDQQYPPDLDGYPEFGDGWMNEEGVRIDMQHRLVPKQPLRSALKQTRAQQPQANTTVPLT